MMRASLEKKKKIVDKLVSLFQKYPTFLIADLYKLKAKHIQSIRKNYRGKIEIIVAKNTLVRKALERLPQFSRHIDEISKYLKGQNLLIFSNLDPFSLFLMFEKNKIPSAASPNDIATDDIIVPAGNTGLQPGPILSKFGALKIPTKIQDGSIWITKDVIVAKKGEVISTDLADILNKLGLKPIMVGIKIKMAYDGDVIPGDVLAIDIEQYKKEIITAVQYAINLSVNVVFPVKESLPIILLKAYINAKTIATKIIAPIPEVIKEVLPLAIIQSKKLSDELSKKHPEIFS
jgi:large subunit ribosomal protein L10